MYIRAPGAIPRVAAAVPGDHMTGRHGQWSELAPEHLIRISMFADSPEVLCRAEAVCNDWRAVLQDGRECSWHLLCLQWYPKMAVRVLEEAAAESESSPVLGPAQARTSSGSFDLGAGYCSASASSSALPSYAPSPATDYAPSPHLGPLVEPLELPLLAAGDEAGDVLRAPAVKCDWRTLFQRRFRKQREWDAEKRRQRRCSANCPTKSFGEEEDSKQRKDDTKKNGKFHPSGRAKVTRGSWDGREKHHHARLRTCKRCGVAFNPHDRDDDGCKWHSGQYVPVSKTDGAAGSSVSREFERKAQNIIKANNRKKGSKQANAIVFDTQGQIQEDGVLWTWSCCGEMNLVAKGCTSGQHS